MPLILLFYRGHIIDWTGGIYQSYSTMISFLLSTRRPGMLGSKEEQVGHGYSSSIDTLLSWW